MKDYIVFNAWLAGLIEGDGCIVVPERRKTGERINYPHIQIAFHKKDKELAKKIIAIIGSGSCDIYNNTVRLTWRKKADLLNVIDRINGNLRTPKILRLHALIDWFNEEEPQKRMKKEVDLSPVGENSWLSGMSDADSNFNIILTGAGSGSFRVQRQWRLEISQKTHHGAEQVGWAMQVSAYIESNLLSRHRYANLTRDKGAPEARPSALYSSWIIVAHSPHSIGKIEEYLERFPLYSSKYLDYKDWKSCGLIKDKNKESYEKVMHIKSGMNSRRTHFNWGHLKD